MLLWKQLAQVAMKLRLSLKTTAYPSMTLKPGSKGLTYQSPLLLFTLLILDIEAMPRDNEFEWNQFCRLGEMMGDGLHHEPDGKWISKEYRRLSRILVPEIKEAEQKARKAKAENIQRQMKPNVLCMSSGTCSTLSNYRRSLCAIAYTPC